MFPGLGFTAEQWERLKALAISLKPGQALWISGYFAGIDHGARALFGDIALPTTSPDSVPGTLVAARPATVRMVQLQG